jgi:uncharacterized protein (TIGR03000 family)
MYSVVLMAALTAGSASQDCCWGGCNWGGGHGYSGCYGGCYGCYGCYGGGYGGYGGCYGGCYGGGYGSYGGCYGCYGGCGGCYGGWSCYGCYGGMSVSPYTPVMPPVDKGPAPEKIAPPAKIGGDLTRAKVVIDVPAQARLYIDDQVMPDKAGKRTFVTPPLQRGQTYFYDVKLEVVQNGQPQVQTTRVVLRSGDVVAATFNSANTGTAVAVGEQ